METSFKLKISKLFQSSFTSCRTKHTSDVVEHPFFFPENHHHRHLINLFSPKPQPISSPSHKPTTQLPLTKLSDEKNHFPAATVAGKSQFHQKNPKPSKKKKPHHRKPLKVNNFQSSIDNSYYDCCSSDDDDDDLIDDETTLFSSRSFSSDSSSVSFRNRNRGRRRKKYKNNKNNKKNKNGVVGGACKGRKATDVIPIKGKFVKDSVAVVKKSNDPHEDFRVSMLEMIVERQIFGEEDLENLLKCFLSLNSEEHHRVICQVFTEIWETLFCF